MRREKHQQIVERVPIKGRSFAGLGGFFLLAVLLGGLWYGAYVENVYGPVMRTVLRVVPLPAAFVQDEVIWMRDVAQLAWFAQASDLDDPYDRAFETAVRRGYIKSLAEEVGVQVDRAVLDQWTQSVDDDFLKLLGWSRGDYERYLAEPLLLEQALEEELYDRVEYQKGAYEQILGLQSQHTDIGIAFADLALQYSQGSSRHASGWLGALAPEDLPAGYAAVLELEINETTIVELDREFALLRVYDKVVQDEEVRLITLQEIIIKKEPLGAILDTYIEEHPIFARLVR